MRKDFKDVIVNSSRYKYGEKISSSLAGIREEELESLPDKQAMRRNHTDWDFEFRDRIQPLRRFLRSNVDRPWDEVFSEICEYADKRNFLGKHFRDHILSEVSGAGGQEIYNRWTYNRFYVDSYGILRYQERHRSHIVHYNPDQCQIDGKRYDRINSCWFEVWYEKRQKSQQYWNYSKGRKEIEYYYIDVRVRQKQLSKRELRRLGLSNDPNVNWWEKNNGKSSS